MKLDIKPEVAEALEKGEAVVALESTIISHGMPYPQNVETAVAVEEIIRRAGAVPATIAILGGRCKVGLTHEEIEQLAQTSDVIKTSRRDLAYVTARGLNGATTVAGTMIIAELAGIRIFVTGGIGGVHRGAQQTMDISADLSELARTEVAVVCAGAKSILDIGLTLEYLETQGVPVIGYKTERFPAFYSQDSGFSVPHSLYSAAEVAEVLAEKHLLGLSGGTVIANPIPDEHALPAEEIESAIEESLREAERRGIAGKEVTPFLLSRLGEITGGRSLAANIELVKHNARVGAEIALELAKRMKG
ncbi:pseudouridine-5'-phosphate glycosidase [Brevibacillus humidisoli]|uniref:pseudouridine-5'-phosphate glycosidase n=1 Tax=Brevibacillus humidisoli TaxID=2895522 RepID=UPI001E5A54E7|nr:pseudouridine-5'-phosphate glycosidase [Brevibacillus humidisoli]UFJ41647.1 pseudouridine-5'-phosphate glycosidase [Brevibacillus humidisoli]